MTTQEYPPLLTRGQAAELTGMSKRYLDKLRNAGTLRVYKMLGGREHRYYREDLEKHFGLGENKNGK
jgi:excisionase family DNA binding protein